MKSPIHPSARHEGLKLLWQRLRGISPRPTIRLEDADTWSRIEHYRDFTQEQLGYLEPKLHRDLWRL
jgi:hypothetical protein